MHGVGEVPCKLLPAVCVSVVRHVQCPLNKTQLVDPFGVQGGVLMSDIFFRGVNFFVMKRDRGGRRVRKSQNYRDVIYEWPPNQ